MSLVHSVALKQTPRGDATLMCRNVEAVSIYSEPTMQSGMVFQMGCFPLVFYQVLRIPNTNNSTKLFFSSLVNWTVFQWSMSVW